MKIVWTATGGLNKKQGQAQRVFSGSLGIKPSQKGSEMFSYAE